MNRLRDAVLKQLGKTLPGATLQVSCAYSDLSVDLNERIAERGVFHVIDVLPMRLQSAREVA
jgi:hypothetical protein